MIIVEQPVFASEVVDILEDKEHRIIHLQWKRFADSRQFRNALTLALQQVIEQEHTGWLANLKHMESILPADEEWASKTWFPKIAQTGLRKMAIVTSLDYFNNIAVKRIMSHVEPGIGFETRYFVDVQDARDWLSS